MAVITPSDVIAGVHIVEPAMHGDERGFFPRALAPPRGFTRATVAVPDATARKNRVANCRGHRRRDARFDSQF